MAQNKIIVYHNGGLCLLTKQDILLSNTKSSSLKNQANSNHDQKANNSMTEYLHNIVIISGHQNILSLNPNNQIILLPFICQRQNNAED